MMSKNRGILSGYRPMRRRQFWTALLVMLLIVSVVGILALLWINRRIIRASRQMLAGQRDLAASYFDCILVPGGPVSQNGQPGLMLESRLAEAVRLFLDGRSDRILISGDSLSPGYDEITAMRDYLLRQGIPADKIIDDPAGLDTFETLFRAQRFFAVQRALITTQPFHLQRALYIADQLKFELAGAPCAMPKDRLSGYFLPREIIARVKAFIDCELLRAHVKR
jgi:SanA protein